MMRSTGYRRAHGITIDSASRDKRFSSCIRVYDRCTMHTVYPRPSFAFHSAGLSRYILRSGHRRRNDADDCASLAILARTRKFLLKSSVDFLSSIAIR